MSTNFERFFTDFNDNSLVIISPGGTGGGRFKPRPGRGWGKGGPGESPNNLSFIGAAGGGRTTPGTTHGVDWSASGREAGDLMLIATWMASNVHPNNYAALGWTELGFLTIGVSTRRISWAYKESAGTEGVENYTTSASALSTLCGVVIRGWDTAQDLSLDDNGATLVSSTTTPDVPVSVTPTFSDPKMWGLFYMGEDQTPTGVPTNYEIGDLTHFANAPANLGSNFIWRLASGAAAEDPSSWTLPVAEGNHGAALFAIKSS